MCVCVSLPPLRQKIKCKDFKKKSCLIHLQNSYNDTKQADRAAKDLNNENLHEKAGILGVRQSGSAAHDADADATEKVGKAHSQTGSKHGVT